MKTNDSGTFPDIESTDDLHVRENNDLQAAAQSHLRDHQWRSAAQAFSAIDRRDSDCQFRLNLARNMADLAERRPELYPILIGALPDAGDKFAVIRGKAGRWTIGTRAEAGRYESLSRGGDPVSSTVQTLNEIRSTWQRGSSTALCGFGDGYVLSALAKYSPKLNLGRQQAICVIEPDLKLVLACLLLHDYSGPDGPIRQQRFRFFLGENWAGEFQREILSDVYLPFPETNICQTTHYAAMEAVFQRLIQIQLENDRQFAQATAEIYDAMKADDLAQLFGDDPPRRPRVLLVTSLFTTVLQYSTASAAQAMQQLGWETKTLIEPTGYHALRKRAIRRAVMDFKPDFVLLIDHLRHEYDGVFPPQLPFACWIQDHLPNLCNLKAGAEVRARDFVLTAIGTHFVQQYGYPARQIVDLPNLARVPVRPTTWKNDGPDLTYISNWSRTTDEVIREVLSQVSASSQLRIIADQSIAQMLGVYERGECLATQRDVRQVVQAAQQLCGILITDPSLLDGLVNLLWDRLNNQLYRHQALCWAADVAKQNGLELALYGRGWETHPELSQFARGVVQHGADLENLVRRSKINLQLEPFACFTHPRLLSGIFAGGFFLVRDHPFNHQPQELLDFIDENLGSEIETVFDARAKVSSPKREALESILIRCSAMSEQADPIQMARNWQRAGLLQAGHLQMADLSHVTFSNSHDLREKIGRFLADEKLRRTVGESLRGDLESRLSYEAGLKRACKKIGDLLRTEKCG